MTQGFNDSHQDPGKTGVSPSLKSCLEKCLVVELRAIARRQELRLQSLLKGDIISQLERRILESAAAKRHESDLPEPVQSALAALVGAGGWLPLEAAQSRFGELRRVVPGAIDSKQPWADGSTTPLDELHCWGAVFRVPAESGGGEIAVVPADLLERLTPAGVRPPRVFRPCAPPAVPSGLSPYLCQDLVLLASALLSSRVRRTSGGQLSRRDLLRLNSHLLAPDDIDDVRVQRCAGRLHFLRALGEALGVLDGTAEYLKPGPALELWIRQPLLDRRVSLVDAYVENYHRCEREMISGVQFAGPIPHEVVSRARRFLLGLLHEAEPGEWYTLSSCVQAARSRSHFLLRRPDDESRVRCAVTGRELTLKDWSLVEGAWIEASLRGPIFWLGLVEIGRNRKGEMVAFRVLPEAASCLDAAMGTTGPEGRASGTGTGSNTAGIVETTIDGAGGDRPAAMLEAAETGAPACDLAAIQVEDDLTVRVGWQADGPRWFRLEQLCDLQERGPVSRYRISREKVRQALQAGAAPDSILADLGEELPRAVVSTIDGWANRFGQVRVFPATVVSVAEPALLSELRGSPEIASCMGQSMGGRACMVVPGQEDRLIQLLRGRGELPHVEPFTPAGIALETWCEVFQALERWKQSAARTGEPGPSESTLQAIRSLAGLEEKPETAVDDGGELPAVDVSVLEEAIRKGQSIVFDYDEPGSRLAGRVTVLPRSVGQERGVTFLAGYRKGGQCMDHFRLDHIHIVPGGAVVSP